MRVPSRLLRLGASPILSMAFASAPASGAWRTSSTSLQGGELPIWCVNSDDIDQLRLAMRCCDHSKFPCEKLHGDDWAHRECKERVLEDAAVLDLSAGAWVALPAKAATGAVEEPCAAQYQHYVPPQRLREVERPPDIRPDITRISPASVDLLVCDTAYLARHGPQLLTPTPHKSKVVLDAPAVQRLQIECALAHFSRVVRRDGLLIIAYQHLLAAAWQALGEALALSDWRCLAVTARPSEPSSDRMLSWRTQPWDAVLICRRCFSEKQPRRRAPLTSQPLSGDALACTGARERAQGPYPLQLIVDPANLAQSTDRVDKFISMVGATRRACRRASRKTSVMRSADLSNLWRALLVAGSRIDTFPAVTPSMPSTPSTVLLADALLMVPEWQPRIKGSRRRQREF